MIGGVNGTVTVRKNLTVKAVLNNVTVQFHSAWEGTPRTLLLQLPCVPTVNAVQPREWVYTVDVRVENSVYTFSIRRNSVAFRSANHASPLSFLSETEQLAMAAPAVRNFFELQVSPEHRSASANVDARFLLQDFPDKLQNVELA